jgi:hypothetical protein
VLIDVNGVSSSIAAIGGLGLRWCAPSPAISTLQPGDWPHRIVDVQDEGSETRTAATSISNPLCEARPVDFQYPCRHNHNMLSRCPTSQEIRTPCRDSENSTQPLSGDNIECQLFG